MYDYVIVDLSLLAPVVVVRVMDSTGRFILVCGRMGQTKIEVARLALSNVRGVCDNLLGIVLNKADMKTFTPYAQGHDTFYNSCYYSRHYDHTG